MRIICCAQMSYIFLYNQHACFSIILLLDFRQWSTTLVQLSPCQSVGVRGVQFAQLALHCLNIICSFTLITKIDEILAFILLHSFITPSSAYMSLASHFFQYLLDITIFSTIVCSQCLGRKNSLANHLHEQDAKEWWEDYVSSHDFPTFALFMSEGQRHNCDLPILLYSCIRKQRV
jgi:hypothetical protein